MRYLDPKTSRWLSTDPALAEYIPGAPVNDEARKRNGNLPGLGGVYNTINLHLYHYAGNNPIKYVDPTGMWGADVHLEKTREWAGQYFSPGAAGIIADANNGVDFSFGTNPLPGIGDQSRHFNMNEGAGSNTSNDSRKVHAAAHMEKAVADATRMKKMEQAYNAAGAIGKFFLNIFGLGKAGIEQAKTSALENLGKGLHSIQDIYAHTDEFVSDDWYGKYHDSPGLNGKTNKADDWDDADERTANTEKATKEYLKEFKDRTGVDW